MRKKNYHHLLTNIFNLYNSKTIILDTIANKSLTYGEFFSKCIKCINFLKKKKTKFEDRIIIKIDNSIEYLIILTSCLLGGFTACPLDTRTPREKFNNLKKIIKPKFIISKESDIKYLDLLEYEKLNQDHTSLILFTSGTTGEPKGIKLSANSFIGLSQSFGKLADYDENSVIYHCLPMHYNAGILNTFFAGILKGSKIILGSKIDSMNIFSLLSSISKYSITSIHLTPEIANGLCQIHSSFSEKQSLKKINNIICTGSYLYEDTRDKFEKIFSKRILSCYGLTEIGGPVTLEKWEDTFEENSAGQILSEVKIKIKKKKKLNHIMVKSPYLFDGYLLKNSKNQKPKLENGFFDTGDIGLVKNNQLFIEGRRKDIFKKGGEIMSSKYLENISQRHLNVKESCVVVKPDQSKGSNIYLFIVFKKVTEINKNVDDMIVFLKKKLKRNEMPDKIIPIPKIPKTSNGKYKTIEIEKIYL